MTEIVVDTSILIDHLRGKQAAKDFLTQTIVKVGSLSCSVITRLEVLAGTRPGEEKAVSALLDLFKSIPVTDDTAEIAAAYMNRFAKSHGLTVPDALIAATAKQQQATLATLDTKHFPMKDINIEVPYV